MKWMLVIMFLTSGRYDAGVDIELFRFHTKEGCVATKQYLEKLYRFETNNKYRNGMLDISDCFKEE